MEFQDLLASLINPGEDGPSPTIYDDLSASYTEATSTRDAKIQVSDEQVAALQAELLAAKAANWDLMQLIPSVDNAGDTGDNGDNADESDESDDVGDEDDFFESDDDEEDKD
jgi:hypothetical protein